MKLKFSKVLKWLPYVKLNLKDALICSELAGDFILGACQAEIDISTETLTLKEVVDLAIKHSVDSTAVR